MRRTTRFQRPRPIFSRVALLVASAFVAQAANAAAQTYTLSLGVWGRGDGYEADVPFVGKSLSNCSFFMTGRNKARTKNDYLTKVAGKTPKTIHGFKTYIEQP